MLKSKFIIDILELLLDGDNEGIKAKLQIEFITESDYKYTSSGVYIGFVHEKEIEKYRCTKKDLVLDGVEIKSSELENGASCTLFFSNGIIDYLEIFCLEGEYPNLELATYELTQVWKNSPKRTITNE